jgi:hypothetical protein
MEKQFRFTLWAVVALSSLQMVVSDISDRYLRKTIEAQSQMLDKAFLSIDKGYQTIMKMRQLDSLEHLPPRPDAMVTIQKLGNMMHLGNVVPQPSSSGIHIVQPQPAK